MEVIIGIVVVLLIWGVVKSMGRSKKLLSHINQIRMNALRDPDRYTQDFNKYDTEEKIKKSITISLYVGLSELGHNVDDYIPGNWEVTTAFNNTINEIYQLVQKS